MCNSCCCCGGASSPTQPPPPVVVEPTPDPRCTRYQVTITSIDVTSVDDGFLGGTLETVWTFVVNGQVQTWINNDLDTGVTAIGLTFFVDVPSPTSSIALQVGGFEKDPFSNDVIAGFSQTWGQAQNWGMGSQSGGNSDSNLTYRINYQIACASSSTFALSKKAVAAYAVDRSKTRKKARQVGVATQASWGLERLRRAGWQLVQVTDDSYILAGSGKLPSLLDKKYGV